MGACNSKAPDLTAITSQIEARYRLNNAIIYAIYDWFSKCIDKANRTRTPLQIKIQQSISQANHLSIHELIDALGMPQSIVSEHIVECASNTRYNKSHVDEDDKLSLSASLSYPEFLELMVVISLCTNDELIAFGYHSFNVTSTRHLSLHDFIHGLTDISTAYVLNVPITGLSLTTKTIIDQTKDHSDKQSVNVSHHPQLHDSPQQSSRMRSISRSSSGSEASSHTGDVELNQSIFVQVMINQIWFISMLKALQLVVQKKTSGAKYWKKQRAKLMAEDPSISQTINDFISRRKPLNKQLATHRSMRHNRKVSTLHSRAMSRVYQNSKQAVNQANGRTETSLATIPAEELSQLRDAARANQANETQSPSMQYRQSSHNGASPSVDQPRSIMKKVGSPLTRTKTHVRAVSHSIHPSINPSVIRPSMRRNSVVPVDSINELPDPQSPTTQLDGLDERRDSVNQSINLAHNQAYSDVDSPMLRPRVGKVSRHPSHFAERKHSGSTTITELDRERIAPPRLKQRVSSMNKSVSAAHADVQPAVQSLPHGQSSEFDMSVLSLTPLADVREVEPLEHVSSHPSLDQSVLDEEGEDEVEQSLTRSVMQSADLYSHDRTSHSQSIKLSFTPSVNQSNLSFIHSNNVSFTQANNTAIKQLIGEDSGSFSPASHQTGWMMRNTQSINHAVSSPAERKRSVKVRRSSVASPASQPGQSNDGPTMPKTSTSPGVIRHIRSKTIHQTTNSILAATKPSVASSISSPSSHRPSVVRLTHTIKPKCSDSPTNLKAVGQATLTPAHQSDNLSPDHFHRPTINTTTGSTSITNQSIKYHSPSSHRRGWHASNDLSNATAAQHSNHSSLGFHSTDSSSTVTNASKGLSPPVGPMMPYVIPPGHPLYTSPRDQLQIGKQSPVVSRQHIPNNPRIVESPPTLSPQRTSGRIVTVAE